MLIGGVIVVILALLGAEVYDNVVDDAGLANLDKPALALSEDSCGAPGWIPPSPPSPILAAGSACPSSAAS